MHVYSEGFVCSQSNGIICVQVEWVLRPLYFLSLNCFYNEREIHCVFMNVRILFCWKGSRDLSCKGFQKLAHIRRLPNTFLCVPRRTLRFNFFHRNQAITPNVHKEIIPHWLERFYSKNISKSFQPFPQTLLWLSKFLNYNCKINT